MSHFTLACLQLNSQDDLAANLAAITAYARDAVAQGAQLLALPENALVMEAPGTQAADRYTMEAHPGVQALQVLAETLACPILVGSVAVVVDDATKRANRSLYIDATGHIAAHYDKIHLFDVDLGNGERYAESAKMLAGRRATLAETPWGLLGLTICYDVRFPHLYRTLAHRGAVMLSVPAAFTAITGEAHWHVLLRARAIETGCFVIAPAQTGLHPGKRATYGHSLVVDPWGRVVADGGTAPGVVMAEIDLAQVAEVRRKLPSLTHDREFS